MKTSLTQRSYLLGLSVIRICDELPKKAGSWSLADQVIRSSTSVGANLVEAKASSSRREFKKYNEIALKSANETIYWLNLLKDSSYLPAEPTDQLINESTELAKMLAAGIVKLKQPIAQL